MAVQDLIYVGLNGRVAALDRETGQMVWEWRSPEGATYVSLLVDRDRLVVRRRRRDIGDDRRSGGRIAVRIRLRRRDDARGKDGAAERRKGDGSDRHGGFSWLERARRTPAP